jgi:hypothetical protein
MKKILFVSFFNERLSLSYASLCFIVSPPTNDGSTLVLVPLNVFLASLNVSYVGKASDTGNDGNTNNRVCRWIIQPNRLVVNLVDDLTRVVTTSHHRTVDRENKKISDDCPKESNRSAQPHWRFCNFLTVQASHENKHDVEYRPVCSVRDLPWDGAEGRACKDIHLGIRCYAISK